MPHLFDPLSFGALTAPNRIFIANFRVRQRLMRARDLILNFDRGKPKLSGVASSRNQIRKQPGLFEIGLFCFALRRTTRKAHG